MDYRVETPRRKVIPNWRYYNNTVNLGELTSFENVNLSDADLYPIDDYISDWIDSKSVYRASDLISAAITNSQKNNKKEHMQGVCELLREKNSSKVGCCFSLDSTGENEPYNHSDAQLLCSFVL